MRIWFTFGSMSCRQQRDGAGREHASENAIVERAGHAALRLLCAGVLEEGGPVWDGEVKSRGGTAQDLYGGYTTEMCVQG